MLLKHIVIYCTVPSKDVGKNIANHLVKNDLAACVNIVPGITSIYFWEGKECEDEELLLIIKSKDSLFDKIKESILSIHPYDVPEIISLQIKDGNNPYLDWINDNTK